MTTLSSILAWRIWWTEDPGGLQSMGAWRVALNQNDLECTTNIHYLGIYIISRDLDHCVEWFALETNGDHLSPLNCKEIQQVHPKGDQSWMFTGRTDVEAETPYTLATWCGEWLTGKDPDARKDWGEEEKGTTEDEMVGWHLRLNGHGFGWTPGIGDGQGGLVCCVSWGHKESDMTEGLSWTELFWDCTQVLHFGSFWPWGLLHFF